MSIKHFPDFKITFKDNADFVSVIDATPVLNAEDVSGQDIWTLGANQSLYEEELAEYNPVLRIEAMARAIGFCGAYMNVHTLHLTDWIDGRLDHHDMVEFFLRALEPNIESMTTLVAEYTNGDVVHWDFVDGALKATNPKNNEEYGGNITLVDRLYLVQIGCSSGDLEFTCTHILKLTPKEDSEEAIRGYVETFWDEDGSEPVSEASGYYRHDTGEHILCFGLKNSQRITPEEAETLKELGVCGVSGDFE